MTQWFWPAMRGDAINLDTPKLSSRLQYVEQRGASRHNILRVGVAPRARGQQQQLPASARMQGARGSWARPTGSSASSHMLCRQPPGVAFVRVTGFAHLLSPSSPQNSASALSTPFLGAPATSRPRDSAARSVHGSSRCGSGAAGAKTGPGAPPGGRISKTASPSRLRRSSSASTRRGSFCAVWRGERLRVRASGFLAILHVATPSQR